MSNVSTSLPQAVESYYWEHFNELSPDKQFHFANRLALWTNDQRAHQVLTELRPQFAPDSPDAIRAALKICLAEQPSTATASYEQRLPYFQKFPQLYGYHQALFRVRHLEVLYGRPAAVIFTEIVSKQSVRELAQALSQDREALRTLSTIAVNFLYLSKRYVDDTLTVDPSLFLDDAAAYNLDDPDELRLFVYLITHCIIGASNYYAEHIPEVDRAGYQRMLEHLESTIARRLPAMSLDTKLEFLVCCRIMGYTSHLERLIYEECAESVSPDGAFLVDTTNVFAARRNKRTLTESEHRNVLFILSNSPFKPR